MRHSSGNNSDGVSKEHGQNTDNFNRSAKTPDQNSASDASVFDDSELMDTASPYNVELILQAGIIIRNTLTKSGLYVCPKIGFLLLIGGWLRG